MSIHPSYRTTKIKAFVADLIIDDEHSCYDDLSDFDKSRLAALLIEAGGRSDEFCCITEATHSDQTINLLKKALSGTVADDQNFLEVLKENVIEYYDYTMRQIFNDVLEDYEDKKNEWRSSIAQFGDPDEQRERMRDAL